MWTRREDSNNTDMNSAIVEQVIRVNVKVRLSLCHEDVLGEVRYSFARF